MKPTKPIDLTTFVFHSSGRPKQPKSKGHLLDTFASWNRKIYAFSNNHRNNGINQIIQKKRDNIESNPNIRDNPGNRAAAARTIMEWQERNQPSYTLTREVLETLTDMLHLPLENNPIQSKHQGDFRHASLFTLNNKLKAGHFYTRGWGQTPGIHMNCSLNTLSEFMATMKMTSLQDLKNHTIKQHGGQRKIDTMAKEISSLDQEGKDIKLLETQSADDKEKMTGDYQKLTNKVTNLKNQLRQSNEGPKKEALQKDFNTANEKHMKMTEIVYGGDDTADRSIAEKKQAWMAKKQGIEGKKVILASLASLDEGMAAGHEDLLSLHMDKLEQSMPKTPTTAQEKIRESTFQTAKQLSQLCDALKNKKPAVLPQAITDTTATPPSNRPASIVDGQQTANMAGQVSQATQQSAIAFMTKVMEKIPLPRRGSPKNERLRLIFMKIAGPTKMTETNLQQHLVEFMQTAAIASTVLDANSEEGSSAKITAIMAILPKDRKNTNTGKESFKLLSKDPDFNELKDIVFGEGSELKKYDNLYDSLKTSAEASQAKAEAEPEQQEKSGNAPSI